MRTAILIMAAHLLEYVGIPTPSGLSAFFIVLAVAAAGAQDVLEIRGGLKD